MVESSDKDDEGRHSEGISPVSKPYVAFGPEQSFATADVEHRIESNPNSQSESEQGTDNNHLSVTSKVVPSWVSLVGASLRLVDAHDSNRQPGTDTPASSPSEHRTGASGGAYISVAWTLLEWLRIQEIEGAFDYVDIGPFAKEAAADYGISVADVEFIAVMLATPSQLRFDVRGTEKTIQRSTSETALLDKQRRGLGFRLSRAGRDALGLAGGYMKWAHAGAEAQKLLIDLRERDLLSFREQALRLLTRIRSEIIEVRQALERPEIEELRAFFMRDSSRFTATLNEVTTVSREVQDMLTEPSTSRAVIEIANANEDHPISLGHLNDLILNIINALRTLQILFSKLLREVSDRERALIGVVRFDAIVTSMLTARDGILVDTSVLDDIMSGVGPLMVDGNAFSPHELLGTIPVKKVREKREAAMLRVGEAVERVDALDLFVNRNRDLLLSKLENGPLTLSEILLSNEFDFRDLDLMIDAAALILSPLTLGLHNNPNIRILISVGDPITWSLDDGWSVSGREMSLSLIDAKSITEVNS